MFQMKALRKRKAAFFVLLLVFLANAVVLSAEDKTSTPAKEPAKATGRDLPVQDILNTSSAKVEAVADSLEYSKDSQKMIARGNAVITYQGIRILADYAEVETDAKKAYAKGHVMIFKGDEPRLQGEEIYYDFGNHTGSFPNGHAMSGIWNARGEDVQQVREGVCKIKKGSVTSCNLEKPHYEIRCKSATLYVNEKLILHSATIYVLGKPVFWLPWLNVPLNLPNIPLQVTQGYNRKNGLELGLIKGITLNKHLWAQARVDWRQQRGVGGGLKTNYDYEKWAKGNIKLYWTQDKKAPTMTWVDPITGNAGNPFDRTEDRDRGQILWRHRTDLDDKTTVLFRYNRVSDPYLVQEFKELEYRDEIQTHSFVTTTRNTEQYGAMVHVEKKMNNFETMVERLPEVRLDWKNQPFFTDKVFNESRVQYDNLKLTSNSYATPNNTAARTDAYSRFFVPLKWNDISFTPTAGYRGTGYNHELNSNDGTYRNVMEYGADLRTHFYRIYDVSTDKMGIDINQLRHIAVPSVALLGAVSSVDRQKLTNYDTTDTVDDSAKVALGLENRLQTKRVVGGKMERVDVVSLNTYLFFDMKPSYENPNMKGARFSTFENNLVLRPYEWLQFQTRVQNDYASHYLKKAEQDVILRKGKWRFLFGYSYVHDYYDYFINQAIQKSHQYIFDARYKLNHLWLVGGYIRWDSANQPNLNEQNWQNGFNSVTNNSQGRGIQEYEISAIRDLHDFILEFGVNSRHSFVNSASDNKNNLNYTVFARFTMKGVPLSFGQAGQAPFTAPRLGQTVAGANESGGFFDSPWVPGEGQPHPSY